VSVHLALKGVSEPNQAVRTVFPDITGIDKYSLAFTATDGGNSETVERSPSAMVSAILQVGTYDLTVTAKKGDTDVAVGTTEGVVISSSGSATASVILGPKPGGGNGTFSYAVTAPEGATGTLTITPAGGGTVSGGTKNLTGGASANTGTISLGPGEYYLAVALTKDSEPAGVGPEVVYSYTGLTSVFERTFTNGHFGNTEPQTNSLQLNSAFAGQETIPLDTNSFSFVQGGTSATFTVTDSGFENINWYLDGAAEAVVTNNVSYTPANNLAVKTHLVVVKAEKGGNSYSEIVAFTVTASGATQQTVGPVNAAGLTGALAALATAATPEAPHTVKLTSVDVAGNEWGTTVKNALDGVEKYIVLDLSACTATGNTITGYNNDDQAQNTDFNIIKSEYIVGIILPNSLTGLGLAAFYRWTGLRSVSIPETATTWGSNIFYGCTDLSNVTIPSGLNMDIGVNEFANCASLTSITIPALVPNVKNNAFNGCTSLTSVTFMGSNTAIANDNTFPNSLKTYYDTQSTKSGVYTWSGSAWSRADLSN
jgi:hypothetical protein